MTKENENNTPALPEGFELVSDGTLAETHDFEKEPAVTGTVAMVKIVNIMRHGKSEPNRVMVIDTDKGKTAVWESAGLKDLFDEIERGDMVYMRYEGLEELSGGRQPMKKFVTAMQPTGLRTVNQIA